MGCPGTAGTQQTCPQPQIILHHELQLENSPRARTQPCNTQGLAGHCKAGEGESGVRGAGWGELASASQGKAARVTDGEGLGRAGAWALLLSPGDLQICNTKPRFPSSAGPREPRSRLGCLQAHAAPQAGRPRRGAACPRRMLRVPRRTPPAISTPGAEIAGQRTAPW